jgi:pilus assembly protein FimV
LGELLNAEIDLVTLQPGEIDALTARVASPEAYREARIEYSGLLRLIRFSIEKRANGQPYLKVVSTQPINEPFLDLLIDMNWPSGRLQREYPILLDPQGFSGTSVVAPAVAQVVPVAPAKKPDAPAVAPAPVAAPEREPVAAAAPAAVGSPSAKTEMGGGMPAPKAASGDNYGPIQKGETLRKIAGEVKPASVSVDQMLAALYRENKAAFIDNNMNLVKTGQILKVPSADEIAKITEKEANEEIRAHVANWKSYREQLAGGVAAMPAKAAPVNVASGKIGTASVAPPAPAVPPSDVLKLSKSDSSKAGAGSKAGGAAQDRVNALQEEVTAKDKALKEAQSRVADLEKQIKDMQRLVDLKAGAPVAKPGETKVAEAPKPAATKTPEPAKPIEAPKPAETKVAEAPKVEPPKIEPPKVEPAKSEPPKPAVPSAEQPKGEAKPAAPKVAPAKAPPPEPSLMDELIDNPAYLAGGVAGVLGLGGIALWMRRRKSKDEGGASSAMTSAFPSDLKPNTVTGKSGGGLVDTGNSSFLTDFDKAGPGTIDTDEVDPVAEAEVYIAYGRDTQAEEILREAMTRDRNRHEIALKLLEIYHNRKSATAFENVAKELHAAIGDSHPMWQKAASMGAQIDPSNPLYVAAAAGTATFAAMTPAAAAPKPDLDFDLEGSPSGTGGSEAPQADTDFDIGLDKPAGHAPDIAFSTPSGESSGLDFDLAPSRPSAADEPATTEKFDFDISGLELPSAKSPGSSAAPSGDGGLGLGDLNLDLGDLGSGSSAPSGGEAVETKLELAKAYLEIGDKDGAREILQEVAKEGSEAVKNEAQRLLGSL